MSSSPGWVQGYVPAAAEWNTTFSGKADESEMAAKANVTDLAGKMNSAGTTTNDNAAAGNIGEYNSNTASGVGMSSSVVGNVASISLTPGDWDVWGTAAFQPAGSTTVSSLSVGIGTVSAAFPSLAAGSYQSLSATFATGGGQNLHAPRQRVSLAAPATVFLVVAATFAVSTMTVAGFIGARRVR